MNVNPKEPSTLVFVGGVLALVVGLVSLVVIVGYSYVTAGIFGLGEHSYYERQFVVDTGVYLSLAGALLLITSVVFELDAGNVISRSKQ